MPKIRETLLLPFSDLLNGLDASLQRFGARGLLGIALGLVAGWWIYVPIHELLHAGGCLLVGGTVDRLEIAETYGGALLAEIFPFVVAGGEYAGRLAGFDTGGSDFVYLVTVLAPYTLTLLPGVWALRRLQGMPFRWAFFLSFALAPFLSIPGDGYEVGSIVVTWVPPFSGLQEELRGDDVFKLADEIGIHGSVGWLGLVSATLLSILWAVATYVLASRIAGALGFRPEFDLLTPQPRSASNAGEDHDHLD